MSEIDDQVAMFDALEGDLFDWRDDPEALIHKSALSALRELAEFLGPEWLAGDDTEGCRIDAWKRKEIAESWLSSVAKVVLDDLTDAFDEDYGPFDNGTDLPDADKVELLAKARELVDLFVAKVPVYQCDKADEVNLTRSAIRAILERAS